MKHFFLIAGCLFFMISCGQKRPYVYTGFYLLADPTNGIAIQKVHTTEAFYLSKTPFAGSGNINHAYLAGDSTHSGRLPELCMEFDSAGTRKLRDVIGNPKYPKVAIVVANRLMYVIDNVNTMDKGIMCVILEGFEDWEMRSMLASVEAKK